MTRSKEAIAKMIATRKANREAKLAKKAERAKALEIRREAARAVALPLNVVPVDNAEEFGRFLAAAWRAYKGL